MDGDFQGGGSPRATRQIESEMLDQIYPALCKLQAVMHNPRRNKQAEVTGETPNGKQYRYTYKYADAASINDAIREPMADNDLFALSRPTFSKEFGHELLTQIIHARSGQWIGCFWPIEAPSKKPQSYAGATTYARRYSINCLLNIATGEDDDASEASRRPATISDRDGGDERDVYIDLLRRARGTKTALDGIALLAAWQDGMATFGAWRLSEIQEQLEGWSLLSSEMRKAVTRAYTPALGDLWLKITAARSSDDVEDVRKLFGEPPAKADIAAMKKGTPKAYSLFMEHMRYFSDWAADLGERAGGGEDEVQQIAAAFTKPDRTELRAAIKADLFDADKIEADQQRADRESAQAIEDLVAGVEQGTASQRLTAPTQPGFSHHVRDEFGDVCTDPITNPLEWAQIYGDLWNEANNLTDLAKHNQEALEELGLPEHEAAQELLANLMAASGETSAAPGLTPPEQLQIHQAPLEWPTNRAGTGVDVAKCVKLVEHELSMLGNGGALGGWLSVNEAVLRDTRIPQSTKMRIDGIIMARTKELGKV